MSRRAARSGWWVVAVVLASCSNAGDAAPPGSDAPTASTGPAAAPPAVPEAPPKSAAGTGTIVVGRTASTFVVTSCRLEPDPAASPAARALVAISGEGTASGGSFTVELQRFATGTDVVTFTDTVTYTDGARILQALRIEVAGEVTDLRDPRASTSLLRTRGDGVQASGLASAPGDVADDGGLIGFALDATC